MRHATASKILSWVLFQYFSGSASRFCHISAAMHNRCGQDNAQSLFGMTRIPTTPQIRNILDEIATEGLFRVFTWVYQALERDGYLKPYQCLGGHLLVTLDGTQYFSSQTIHCEYCSSRTHRNGNDHSVKDRLIQLGTIRRGAPVLTLRLIEIKVRKTSYSYITSVLDPQILPPYVVADLYKRRWRIEYAFYVVKRLLGLSYLWTGSINGVKLQVWATWLFYAVLVDLGDAIRLWRQRFAIADELSLPFDRISLEMIFRGFYHFSVAYDKGKAEDPVKYFAE